MDSPHRDSNLETIGREVELARIRAFVMGRMPERTLVIEGVPGVGKTTLWRVALDIARGDGVTVLATTPGQVDAAMPFSSLGDLLETVGDDVAPEMPAPQRRALAVALLREDAGVHPPEPRAIALGVLQVLRGLAQRGRLLIAIDDLQWADRASLEVLSFAVRRAPDAVSVLIARRPGPATVVEASPADSALSITLDGLSLGAIRRLLVSRLGLEVPRRVLRQIADATLGNPLFALEIGRTLRETGIPAVGQVLRLPRSLEDMLGTRVISASAGRPALLAVALGGALTPATVTRVTTSRAVGEAIRSGLLVEESGRLRPAHPLLAAAAEHASGPAELREMHGRLAALESDPIRRARHLAAATTEWDPVLAEELERAGVAAYERGAAEDAIELAEHALRLTPSGDPRRDARVLSLGEFLNRADETGRLEELLRVEIGTLSPGLGRARGYLLLEELAADQAEYDLLLDLASQETEDPGIRSSVLARQAADLASSWAERLAEAEDKARRALAMAPTSEVRQEAAYALAWALALQGHPFEDLLGSVDDNADWVDRRHSIARIVGIRASFRGEIERARSIFEDELRKADELGQVNSALYFLHQLSEVVLRSGDSRTAARVIEAKVDRDTSPRGAMRAHVARLLALQAAVQGDGESAQAWATNALELVEGQRWDTLEAWRAEGLAALLVDAPARALQPLQRVWSHTQAEGVEPGAFPVAPDLVEAAIGADQVELATEVTRELADRSASLDHPWGLASVARCEGLLLAIAGEVEAGADRVHAAVERYDALGCRFDAARSLLAFGRAARRSRRWAVARDAVDEAARRFAELGCDGWEAKARGTAAGLGGRRPTPRGALSPSEQRVARMAAEGRSNKDIAAALYVGVHTVEVHLAQAYAKLSIGSRSQLGAALRRHDLASTDPGSDAPPMN